MASQRTNKLKEVLKRYTILTLATIVIIVGIYVFKFPNNFSFGGVTGAAVVLAPFLPITPGTVTLVVNLALLLVGFLVLGKSFGIMTAYVSILMSVGLRLCEVWFPLTKPITDEPVLELIFAIVLPAFSSAVYFNIGASGGGTDIIAMILKKYTKLNIATALFVVDLLIVIAACFVFDTKTGLFSLTGLLAKSLVVDSVIENINLCKCFTIICDNPKPIVDYIINDLGRGATTQKAEGAFAHTEKTVIITITNRFQAVELRQFIKKTEPQAFIAITNSSEIIGKGFRGVD